MIGNDVVDLNTAKVESDWRRDGYLEKIFTSNEQEFIHASTDKDTAVWTLWSRKEAVYKIINRESAHRFYNPLSISCGVGSEEGKVCYGRELFFTDTICNEDFIHSVALRQADFSKITQLEQHQIIKKNQLPFYFNSKHNSLLPASVSHHGRFYFAVGVRF